ncbi:hypothetical protein CRUP_024857 [Coryphaenoides rupestris]|nr:hypothetical protein CRUP_024857 [Coryphaenoides rupestris]
MACTSTRWVTSPQIVTAVEVTMILLANNMEDQRTLKGLACGIIARSAGLFQNAKQICACDGVTLWEERDRPLAGTGRRKETANL